MASRADLGKLSAGSDLRLADLKKISKLFEVTLKALRNAKNETRVTNQKDLFETLIGIGEDDKKALDEKIAIYDARIKNKSDLEIEESTRRYWFTQYYAFKQRANEELAAYRMGGSKSFLLDFYQ